MSCRLAECIFPLAGCYDFSFGVLVGHGRPSEKNLQLRHDQIHHLPKKKKMLAWWEKNNVLSKGFLFGGWTTPFEKYALVKLDHFPKKLGWKFKKNEVSVSPPWFCSLLIWGIQFLSLLNQPFSGQLAIKQTRQKMACSAARKASPGSSSGWFWVVVPVPQKRYVRIIFGERCRHKIMNLRHIKSIKVHEFVQCFSSDSVSSFNPILL